MNNLVIFLASTTAEQGGAGAIAGWLPFVLIIAIVYFLMIRPQAKKQKEHQQMINQIGKGDKVISIGGIHGTIIEVKENSLLMQVSKNSEITLDKSSIASVVKKNEKEA